LLEVQIIHGDINQKQREATIEGFKKGKFKCLVATDVAARGLDIPSVDLIIQSEPPKDVDTYIHRAGRTARAGREGVCITLYTKIQEDLLRRISRVAKIQFKKVGAPQKDEIISSNLRDITHSISAIDPGVKTLFEAPAKVR
jgi:ATP-dependent RNA helicase DDX21